MRLNETRLYDWEVEGLIRLGYTLELPIDTIFQHSDKKLIATKKINGQTVKVYLEAWPAHFYYITVPTNEGHLYEITTGSGSAETYLEALESTLNLMTESMIGIKQLDPNSEKTGE